VEKLLADAHRSRLVDLGEFLEYVQTLRDVGLREGEAPVDASGAVQLMSIHKSKGLEFPLVVIADAAHELRSPAAGALLDADLGLLPGLKDDSDVQRAAHPVAWRLAYLNEAAKNKAEDRRLLYVAATRAREKLLVSGHASVSKTNQLSLSGWLVDLGKVLGVDKMTLDEETLNTSGWSATFPSQDGFISWIVYPPAPPTSHPPPEVDRSSKMDAVPGELLAPLSPPPPENLDEGTLARESDPPQRVWRVVPQVNRPSGPAWVVGKLVHEALRRWQFPGSGDLRFEEFIRPYTLEAGLTDEGEIRATIQETRRLLERFRRHPLYAEIEAAERFHELPFVLANDRGVIDLLYRAGEKADKQHPWVILDFKTDEARSTAEAQAIISQKGYDKQVQRYIEAVTISLGCRPQARLVFLQVGREIGIFEI
jgi:ATP-dependent exoDNAse (exonuclease V) beta subunit